jgi:hypothetical protein
MATEQGSKLMVVDPDSYWVEIIGQKSLEETENVTETSTETYRMVCVHLFSRSSSC